MRHLCGCAAAALVIGLLSACMQLPPRIAAELVSADDKRLNHYAIQPDWQAAPAQQAAGCGPQPC